MVETTGTFAETNIGKVKDYWNERPYNIRHSTEEVGSKEYFDQVEARKYRVEPHIPTFAEFDKWKGKKVLEVGCGIGTDTINFARAGAQVTAVDLSIESINLAKKRADVFNLSDKITFYQANAEELSKSVPMDKYDLIYSFGVIHHTPCPENTVKEMKLFAKKGADLKLMVYNRWSWKVLWIMMTDGKFRFWELDKFIAKNSEAQTGCPVTYSYSSKSVKKLLSGIKVKRAMPDHIFPYSIPEYKEYKYKKVWYFRWMPKPLFRAIEKIFGWHLCVDATFE
jgi:2-polyprenyl-3-methyl-5-hydroxy-6-metoxy-1,4-benzoquinol methylase